ncbi:Rne/Rng family ribonuclease [Ancylothrix sp. C2]|uniref:Rne/Rng family ribonuclease n=1 Tax=Ancylothrix sp. D3o TaxID=2953691 RepID=UPI0021BADE32|nr:Rne/Rng family ribonuclease [Ancylothrix sp. D3o]MCT7950204.1 Rne/Rng family ribonuclease [Ancylothrix sp. D3o]
MPKQIIIAEQHRIAAVFSEDQIQELVVATGQHQVGDIYLGVVENVLPGIDAAFVNIGDAERNGFIHVTDLGPLRLKRSAGAITELLVPQQKVLVQVMKEPTGTKGPRLTGNITLPGRYLVLMPYGRGVNLSRRIRNENERNRLRALAILVKPAGMGLLVRTEAEGMGEEAIIEDLEILQRQWETIQQEAVSTRAPSLLNRDDDFIQRVLRDMYSSDVNRIVVDSQSAIKRVKQQILTWSGGKPPQGVLIDHHRERTPVLEYFRVNAAIREALKPRVDLPSGGYIIIEPTEALTVIDVNSGSFTRSATARETVLWTNCEASTEIARQLRLRNIAGVIIVDFIDMDSRRDQLQVLEHFNKALKADKARPQIAQLSELGLVELTRKRQGQNIYELFGRTCSSCGGFGHLVHLPGEPEQSPGEPVERLSAMAMREARARSSAENVGTPTPEANLWQVPGERSSNLKISRSPEATSETLDFGEAPSLPVSRLGLNNLPGREVSSPERSPSEPAELEPLSDFQETGSAYNANYPDRGGGDIRRRRRRRIGDPATPEAGWRENNIDEVAPAASSRPVLPAKPATKIEEPAPEPEVPEDFSFSMPPRENTTLSERERNSLPLPRPRSSMSESPRNFEERANIQGPPSARGRFYGREAISSPPEPPEVIAVEMTPEEQEIYGMMGVSPLLLAEGEVKNPKTAIVSVLSPGQSPDTVPPPPPARESLPVRRGSVKPTLSSSRFSRMDDESMELMEEESNLPSRHDFSSYDEPVSESFNEAPPESSMSSESSESDPENEADSGTALNRRRRRRSSATDSDQGRG